ncbi:MAG: hypothetical protein SFU98_18315 [Leptospiraceae bacterium]|nr:hypothetical protein [Leptospiraceae bacterium]
MNKNLLFRLSFFLILSSSTILSQSDTKSNEEYLDENKKIINQKKDKVNELETNNKERREEPDFLVQGRKSNFFVLGGSIGTPASANLNIGYYFNRFVVRASGMHYYPKWNGYQFDLGYSFYKTNEVIMGFSLVGGSYKVNPFNPQVGAGGQNEYRDSSSFPGYQYTNPRFEDTIIRAYIANQDPQLFALLEYDASQRKNQTFSQNYVGLAYDLYLDGFFLQLGAGVGKGAYRDPQLIFQMGYVFDFGKNK